MVEFGTYTPTEDVLAAQVNIQHSLGTVPDFVVVMSDEFTSSSEFTKMYIGNAYCSKVNLRYANGNQLSGYCARVSNNPTNPSGSQAFNVVTNYTNMLHTDYFNIPYYRADSDYLKANLTYHYVIGTFQ